MCCCKEETCGSRRGIGILIVVLGLLMLINLTLWPQWLGFDGWMGFFAVILLVFGVAEIIGPMKAKCCETPKETPTTPAPVAPVVEAPTVTPHKSAKKKK